MSNLSDAAMSRLRDIGLDERASDRFRIEREVGRGGSGRVFEAHDGETGKRVALKVLESHRVADLARFNLESAVLEEMDHHSIVRYLAHGVTSAGEHFIATEWLEGETLATRLAREGRLGVIETIVLVRDLARALAVVHARGVVHRDLKPSNVFLVDGRMASPKILDFGLARRPGQNLTRPGEVMGTMGFMSPEQARGLASIDGRADLFSLGAVAYLCLTGRPPFDADDAIATLAKVMLAAPVPPRVVRDSIPLEVETIVLRLLAKDVRERPATATSAADELDAWLRDPTAPTPPHAAQPTQPSEPPTPPHPTRPSLTVVPTTRASATVDDRLPVVVPLPIAAPTPRGRSVAHVALGIAFLALAFSIIAAWGVLHGGERDDDETAPTRPIATGAPRRPTEPVEVGAPVDDPLVIDLAHASATAPVGGVPPIGAVPPMGGPPIVTTPDVPQVYPQAVPTTIQPPTINGRTPPPIVIPAPDPRRDPFEHF